MNFEKILSECNIPIAPEGHHHARPDWIQFDCPFCGRGSKAYHMGYSIEGNYVNCWRCGFHPLTQTLIAHTGLSYPQVKRLLDGLETTKIKRTKPLGKLVLPKGVGKLLPLHKKYLRSRGFDWKKIQQLWNIQGFGIAPNLSWRIFIPIIYHSNIVSWTTRTISLSGRVNRYISANENQEAMPHHDLLYGEDYARHAIIINEGITDVWRIGPGAVATFGTGYSQAQVNRMVKYPVRAICFDNEPEAQKRARTLSDDLSAFPGDTYNVALDKKDAAAESRKNIRRLRKEILE